MQKLLDALLKAADGLARVTSVASRIMLLAVAAMLFVQVVLRYVFLYSLPWPEEASRYLMIWVVMITGSLLVKDEQLVSVDFFDALWPKRVIAYRNAIFRVMLVGLLCVLFKEGLDQALFAWNRTTTALQVSWFWPYLAVPVGSALMIFHMAVLALRDILRPEGVQQEASVLRADI